MRLRTRSPARMTGIFPASVSPAFSAFFGSSKPTPIERGSADFTHHSIYGEMVALYYTLA